MTQTLPSPSVRPSRTGFRLRRFLLVVRAASWLPTLLALVWLGPPAAEGASFGTERIIESSLSFSGSLFCTDVDGDGDVDLVVLKDVKKKRVNWFENNGDGSAWTRNEPSAPVKDGTGVHAADIESDGDMDLLAIGQFDDKLWILANDGAQTFTETSLTISSNALSLVAADVGRDVVRAGRAGEGGGLLVDDDGVRGLGGILGSGGPGAGAGDAAVAGSGDGEDDGVAGGIAALEYDLVDVPLDPNDGDAGAVVGDDLGGAGEYESKWRVVKYDVATESIEYYTGAASLPEFAPGRGFWMIHDGSVADPATIDVEGRELHQVVGSPPIDGAQVVDLSKPSARTAKHMVADPFDRGVERGRVKSRSPENPGVGVTARNAAAPETGADAAVVGAGGAGQGGSGGVMAVRGTRRGGGGVEKPSERRWLLDLQVREVDGPARDLYHRLGVVPGSVDGRDRHDALDLAPFGRGWVRLYFPHDDRS